MKIEDMTKESLSQARDRVLFSLRHRIVQIWDKNFKDTMNKSTKGGIDRHDLLRKYRQLLHELNSRSLQHSTEDIDRQAFKKAMEIKRTGIDLDQFEPVADGEVYAALKKGFQNEESIEVLVQEDEENRNEKFEKEVAATIKSQMSKECTFLYTKGFCGEVIPIYKRIVQPNNVAASMVLENAQETKDVTEAMGVKKFEEEILVVPMLKKDEERIVYGVVYEPDSTDAQGDAASAREIKKAAYRFMEEAQVFKVNHQGSNVPVKILENFLAPTTFSVGKKKIKKGSWVLVTRVLDDNVWEDIKSGKLTGYSMAGYARAS